MKTEKEGTATTAISSTPFSENKNNTTSHTGKRKRCTHAERGKKKKNQKILPFFFLFVFPFFTLFSSCCEKCLGYHGGCVTL